MNRLARKPARASSDLEVIRVELEKRAGRLPCATRNAEEDTCLLVGIAPHYVVSSQF